MMSVECIKGIPFGYESFLIEKYDSYTTSCYHIQIFNPEAEIYHLLCRENEKIADILVFKIKKDTCTCLNTIVYIDSGVLDLFCNYIFTHFPSVQKIRLLTQYNVDYKPAWRIAYNCSSDFVADLPTTITEYYSQLGRHECKRFRKEKQKLLLDFPDTHFEMKYGKEIDAALVDQIVRLNFKRAISKGGIPHSGRPYAMKLAEYAQYYGCVAYIEVGGSVVAGNIAFLSSVSIYGDVIAHDNDFSKYSIGNLCHLYLIESAIEKGFFKMHFLWGESGQKKLFLAQPRLICSFLIYRQFSGEYLIAKIKEFSARVFNRIKSVQSLCFLKDALVLLRKRRNEKLCVGIRYEDIGT